MTFTTIVIDNLISFAPTIMTFILISLILNLILLIISIKKLKEGEEE